MRDRYESFLGYVWGIVYWATYAVLLAVFMVRNAINIAYDDAENDHPRILIKL